MAVVENLIMPAALGVGATMFLDLWGVAQSRVLGIPSLDYRLVGRWLVLLPKGRILHAPITTTPSVPGEAFIGWAAHYIIGLIFGIAFIGLMGVDWISAPSLFPAIWFGMFTVIAPYFVLQPCLGAGIAASRAPAPNRARLLSFTAHTIFGLGLYLTALIIRSVSG
ncbi:DUF2938 domain-containing protein [Sphingorhabdus sp. EL138]|uniref:DUF2938 domain-containing protein n=1 Tax=Sphingorhabdus sp. EL138 TaxID=2073156 RepID=UPI001C1F4A14|nr:DUF2938 domain-containing protein [Sphingorhabdus sp. EL138]